MPSPGCSLPEQPFSSSTICVILALTERKSPDSGGSAMTFDEILAQIIDLLKRQGRVSYSALKRRFDLDDDYLNDLKDEILFTSPQIVDEGGRGLVWVGETGTPPASISTPPAQPYITPQTPPTQVASPPTAPHTPEAERRQLTVMFCDLLCPTAKN